MAIKRKFEINDYSPVELVTLKINKLEAELAELREQLRQRDEMLAAASEISGPGWTLRKGIIANKPITGKWYRGTDVSETFDSAVEVYAAIK